MWTHCIPGPVDVSADTACQPCTSRSRVLKREGGWDETSECAVGLRALAGTVKGQACPQQRVFTPSTVTDPSSPSPPAFNLSQHQGNFY